MFSQEFRIALVRSFYAFSFQSYYHKSIYIQSELVYLMLLLFRNQVYCIQIFKGILKSWIGGSCCCRLLSETFMDLIVKFGNCSYAYKVMRMQIFIFFSLNV